jgi:hypothetical protein
MQVRNRNDLGGEAVSRYEGASRGELYFVYSHVLRCEQYVSAELLKVFCLQSSSWPCKVLLSAGELSAVGLSTGRKTPCKAATRA